MEKILKAFANRRRLAIIKHLKKEGESPVGEIARAINLSFKSTARHLAVLFLADLLEKEQRSSFVFYRLAKTYHKFPQSIINFI